MDFSEVELGLMSWIRTVEAAEAWLREMAVNSIRQETGYDMNAVISSLQCAEDLKACLSSMRKLYQEMVDRAADEKKEFDNVASLDSSLLGAESETEVGEGENGFPYVFVTDGSLYKIGRKSKPNSDGAYGTWWKSVPIDEARTIMETIYSFGSDSFKQGIVQKETLRRNKKIETLPSYKVDIVFSGLKKTKCIKQRARGTYRVVSGNPTEWIARIKLLPDRSDLMSSSK